MAITVGQPLPQATGSTPAGVGGGQSRPGTPDCIRGYSWLNSFGVGGGLCTLSSPHPKVLGTGLWGVPRLRRMGRQEACLAGTA